MRHAPWKTAKVGAEVSKVTAEPAEAAERVGSAEATARVVLAGTVGKVALEVETAGMVDLAAGKTILAGGAAETIAEVDAKIPTAETLETVGNDKLS